LAFEDGSKEPHVVGDHQGVGSQAGFMQRCFNHPSAYGTEYIGLKDLAVDLFVKLIFKVADVFGHFVLDADEADGFLLRRAIWGDAALFFLACEQLPYRLIDEWMEDFGTRFVATDEVLRAGLYKVSVLVTPAPGDAAENGCEACACQGRTKPLATAWMFIIAFALVSALRLVEVFGLGPL
jgi:hypothetical protein